nr:Scr1 family TA system antitoxin-like transcriptional regulator [Streptomyces qinglanensis]
MRSPPALLLGDGTDSEPPTVYADGYTGCLYLDKPKEVEAFADAFDSIWTTALDEHASRRLVYYLGMPFRRRPGGSVPDGRAAPSAGPRAGPVCVR